MRQALKKRAGSTVIYISSLQGLNPEGRQFMQDVAILDKGNNFIEGTCNHCNTPRKNLKQYHFPKGAIVRGTAKIDSKPYIRFDGTEDFCLTPTSNCRLANEDEIKMYLEKFPNHFNQNLQKNKKFKKRVR